MELSDLYPVSHKRGLTNEHVIPESFGGALQVRFLCKQCTLRSATSGRLWPARTPRFGWPSRTWRRRFRGSQNGSQKANGTWLVYRVHFLGLAIQGPRVIYQHDLKANYETLTCAEQRHAG